MQFTTTCMGTNLDCKNDIVLLTSIRRIESAPRRAATLLTAPTARRATRAAQRRRGGRTAPASRGQRLRCSGARRRVAREPRAARRRSPPPLKPSFCCFDCETNKAMAITQSAAIAGAGSIGLATANDTCWDKYLQIIIDSNFWIESVVICNICRSPRRGANLAGKRKRYHFLQSKVLDCKK